MPSNSVFWSSVVAEILLIAAVSVTSILMRKFLEPFHLGFFKDDESLMHPYKDSSVTNVMLYTVGFLVPTFMIILMEFVIVKLSSTRHRRRRHENDQPSPDWALAAWVSYSVLCPFFFGAAATHALTNLGKYSVGRLRPHFFAVCKPDWSLLNDTYGYIEKDICTQTDEKKMTEARLSFPSGHSSIAIYCAIFFCLYLHMRFTWKRVTLLCPLFQLVIFGTAVYTSLSRIHDFKHHWSDALAGGFLGALIAVVSMLRITHAFKEKRLPFKKNISTVESSNQNNHTTQGNHDNQVYNTFM